MIDSQIIKLEEKMAKLKNQVEEIVLKELIYVYRIRPLKVCIHLDLKPYLTEMNILPENLCVTNLRVIYALINFHLGVSPTFCTKVPLR